MIKLGKLKDAQSTKFYTEEGTLIAEGFVRLVIGERGPYIEFSPEQMKKENMYIPPKAEWRLTNRVCYYVEFRSRDGSNIMIYFQRREVNYADYRVGMFYISPMEIIPEKEKRIQQSLEVSK